MNNLYEQLAAKPLDLDCVAMICNTTADNHGFRISLRGIPAFAGAFTIGDAAVAYFSHMTKEVEAMFPRKGAAK